MDRCIKFREDLLVRRMYLDGKFYGFLRFGGNSDSFKMNCNEEAFALLDLLDEGRTVSECVGMIAGAVGVEGSEVKKKVDLIVSEIVDNEAGSWCDKEKCCFPQNIISDPIELKGPNNFDSVMIELLSACNLKCKHCYGSFDTKERCELSREQVFDILDQLSDLHCETVSFTGGEVLLHEDFAEILSYAEKKKFKLFFLTNGFRLTEEFVKKIADIASLTIQVSIDGHRQEIHDDFRGVRGSFERVVESVKLFRKYGFEVIVSHIVHRKNCLYLKDMKGFVDSLDAEFKFSPMYRCGNGADHQYDYYLNPSEYYSVCKAYYCDEYKEETENTVEGIDCVERCVAGRSRFTIKPDGSVVPCEILPDITGLVAGNINEDKLEDIIAGFDRENVLGKMNALDIKVCSECSEVESCAGGCVGVPIMEYGVPDKPDMFRCASIKGELGKPLPGI